MYYLTKKLAEYHLVYNKYWKKVKIKSKPFNGIHWFLNNSDENILVTGGNSSRISLWVSREQRTLSALSFISHSLGRQRYCFFLCDDRGVKSEQKWDRLTAHSKNAGVPRLGFLSCNTASPRVPCVAPMGAGQQAAPTRSWCSGCFLTSDSSHETVRLTW